MKLIKKDLFLVLILLLVSACQKYQANSGVEDIQSEYPPEVATVPFHSGSEVTDQQIESIRKYLSSNKRTSLREVEQILPDGFGFLGVSYALVSEFDENDILKPYTRSIYVCRLSQKRDLVLTVNNREGENTIQKWRIRDLPN